MASTAEERLTNARLMLEAWDRHWREYPGTPEGAYAAAAVRCCIREMGAVLDDELDRLSYGVEGELARARGG